MIPSVLLPGTLCDARVFAGILPGLQAPRVLDHSGHDDARRAAADLIPQIPERCIGIAFSLGGWVLLELLRLAPERFAGIVLLSGNGYPHPAPQATARRERAVAAQSIGLRAMIEGDWPMLVGTRSASDAALRTLVGDMAETCGLAVNARQVEMNIGRPDHRETLRDPGVPLLVIAGAEDRLCPPERYAEAAAGPQSRLVTLPGIGHFVPLEAPDAVLREIGATFEGAKT